MNISGYEITPFLLSKIEKLTHGSSLESNITLVLNNAKIASEISIEYQKLLKKDARINYIPVDNTQLAHNQVNTTPLDHTLPSNDVLKSSVVKKRMSSRIITVGGAVIDMIGTIKSNLIMKSSNPGELKTMYGGVAFNIAQHLTLRTVSDDSTASAESNDNSTLEKKHSVTIVSAIGLDAQGQGLLSYSKNIGINISHLESIANQLVSSSDRSDSLNTATYTAIHGPDGDLVVAVADMAIFKYLTSNHIEQISSHIRQCDILVSDG